MNETAELYFEYSNQASIIRRRIRRLKQLRVLADEQELSQLEERIKNLREILLDVIFAIECLRRYVPK